MSVRDNLITALRNVRDLDALQALTASNELADTYSPPLRDWLLQFIRAERDRRETGAEPSYPFCEFSEWPAGPLIATTNFALMITEAALIVGDPAIQNFALRLQELFVGSLCLALLKRIA